MKTEAKDEASLADQFVSATYQWAKYFGLTAHETKLIDWVPAHYRQAMRNAQKFVLDDQFTEYATIMAAANMTPQKLLYRMQFASLPYETTWVEFNLRAKVGASRTLAGLDPEPPYDTPGRLGLLLQRIDDRSAAVTCVSDGLSPIRDLVAPNLTGYFFSNDNRDFKQHHKMTSFDGKFRSLELMRLQRLPPDKDLEEVMNRVSKGSLWGFGDFRKSMGIIDSTADFVTRVALPEVLEQRGDLAFSAWYDFFETIDKLRKKRLMERLSEMMSSEITEFSGTMRWVITLLAMLNEVPTRADYVQPSHQIRVGLTSRRPAFDYHKVSLKLPKTKPVPYLERHLRNIERRHRAHQVRGFWRHYYNEHRCKNDEHEWEWDTDNGYGLCGKCMSFTTWVREHVRGDPTLGWVRHDYVISKQKD